MREKLIETIKCLPRWCGTKGAVEAFADCLLAVDVVPVVRCKDCKHFDPEKALRPGGIWCVYWGTDPDPDDFCCKGERKDNEC